MTQIRDIVGIRGAAEVIRDVAAATGRSIARIRDAGIRQRIHGVVLLLTGITGLATSLMMGEHVLMTAAGALMGGYGLYLSLG